MPKIHDWEREEWYNKKRAEAEGRQVLCVWENEAGESVDYRYADDEAEHSYEVHHNDQLVEDVEISHPNLTEGEPEHFEALVFGSRKDAREGAAALMQTLPPVEELPEDWQELQHLAKMRGVYEAGDGREDLEEKLAG